MPSVEACARCAAEKASLTKRSPQRASLAAKSGSFFSSPSWKRRFSSTAISPGPSASTALSAVGPMQSGTNCMGRPSSSPSLAATGLQAKRRIGAVLGPAEVRDHDDAAPRARRDPAGPAEPRQPRGVRDDAVLDRHVEIGAHEHALVGDVDVGDRLELVEVHARPYLASSAARSATTLSGGEAEVLDRASAPAPRRRNRRGRRSAPLVAQPLVPALRDAGLDGDARRAAQHLRAVGRGLARGTAPSTASTRRRRARPPWRARRAASTAMPTSDAGRDQASRRAPPSGSRRT